MKKSSSERPADAENPNRGPIVCVLEDKPELVRAAIKKRLAFACEFFGISFEEAPFQFDEGALTRIQELSQCSIGKALLLVRIAFEQIITPNIDPTGQFTVVVEAGDIDSLGFTPASLDDFWDHPMRDAIVIHVKSPWEK